MEGHIEQRVERFMAIEFFMPGDLPNRLAGESVEGFHGLVMLDGGHGQRREINPGGEILGLGVCAKGEHSGKNYREEAKKRRYAKKSN